MTVLAGLFRPFFKWLLDGDLDLERMVTLRGEMRFCLLGRERNGLEECWLKRYLTYRPLVPECSTFPLNLRPPKKAKDATGIEPKINKSGNGSGKTYWLSENEPPSPLTKWGPQRTYVLRNGKNDNHLLKKLHFLKQTPIVWPVGIDHISGGGPLWPFL